MRKPSDFREDRDMNFDPPSDDAPMREKVEYQKKLQRAWDYAAQNPGFDILSIPMEDPDRWWTHPTSPSPEYIHKQVQRQMRRYADEK